jgi:DNA modification methylase
VGEAHAVSVRILQGDCRDVLKTLPDESVHCVVTSPPYWGLRDYGVAGQLGLESTPQEYIEKMVAVFREVRRVLRSDGTLWLNMGDSYVANRGNTSAKPGYDNKAAAGHANLANRKHKIGGDGLKEKDLVGIPWMLAFALRADGWWLRQDIIWSKPNPMPESVRDRCTKAHEYIFLLAKSERYWYDSVAIQEAASGWNGSTFDGPRDLEVRPNTGRKPRGGGFSRSYAEAQPDHGAMSLERPEDDGTRNKRSVWTVTTQPFKEAHFATFPPALIEPCILAGCPAGGVVLDPFGGAGTTGLVADRLGRDAILIELNPMYADMARKRIVGDAPLFAEVA